MSAPAHRILLVEDDPSIARFVSMVLEELPLELTVCTSAEQAEPLLREGGFALLITDLMLPGMSGVELLQRLREPPAVACPAVVFSAGIDEATAQRLLQLQVLRTLRKPVSVAELLACVESALQSVAAPAAPAAQAPGSAPQAVDPLPAAVDVFFGGDQVLFDSYRAACLAQLPSDLEQGQRLLAQRDAAALRRLAHSLKSVVRMLGLAQAADRAQALEQACLQQDWDQVQDHWAFLQARIDALIAAN